MDNHQSAAALQKILQFSALFTSTERTEFPHAQALTADALVELIATHSAVLVKDPADRARLLAKIRSYLASRPETAEGEFDLPMVTSVIRSVRRG